MKRRELLIALTALAAAASLAPLHAQERAATVALTGVTVIDPSPDAAPLTNQTIIITDGVIRAIGPAGRTRVPRGAQVVNARGKFAIPGLWDMHVHFMNAGVTALPLLLAHGVTSVREMGGYIDSTRRWQERMAAGTLAGPRIVTPGPMLESPRYLANVRERDTRLGGRLAPRILPYRLGVADSADAERVVDSLVRLQVDFVKFRTVVSREAYFGILRAARRAGLKVAGHAPAGVRLSGASDSGQSTIEHAFNPALSGVPFMERQGLYDRFARNGTWYVPTLVVSRAVLTTTEAGRRGLEWTDDESAPRRYAPKWMLDWWRMQVDERALDSAEARTIAASRAVYESNLEDVRAMQAAGVRILAGTDAGSTFVYPGFSLHEELRLLVEDAGLTPRQALWSATVGPARWAGLESELGTITAGHRADIVLLHADPLAGIRNTTRIFAVIQGGRVWSRRDLDALLAGIRAGVAAEPR